MKDHIENEVDNCDNLDMMFEEFGSASVCEHKLEKILADKSIELRTIEKQKEVKQKCDFGDITSRY